jgi:lysophospholipase L1-like esterase
MKKSPAMLILTTLSIALIAARPRQGDPNRSEAPMVEPPRPGVGLPVRAALVQDSAPGTPLMIFDFGSGRIAKGWTPVLPDMEITRERGYGFEPGQKLEAVDRGGDPLKGDFITSARPFLFSVVLPEGNYWVRVTLGDDKGAGENTVKAELRRLMIEGLTTAPGEHAERTFMVNIRIPKIPGGGDVRLKPRERVGESEAVAWDNKLTIEFNGSRPCVNAVEIGKAPEGIPVIYIMGDSTVCDQPTPPWNSWGQMLTRWLKPGVVVANHAESGESFASSISEQRLAKVMTTLKKGDYLFMQFGHNDMKGGTVEETHYTESIKRYIDSARSKGAVPVLITSMHRRTFDAGGRILNSLNEYPQAVRDVAKGEQIALIDLHAMSKTLYETLGPKTAELLFAESQPGVYDGTHHGDYGSYELSKCIVEGILAANLDLGNYVADDYKHFDPAKPDQPAQVRIPVSPGFSNIRPLGN